MRDPAAAAFHRSLCFAVTGVALFPELQPERIADGGRDKGGDGGERE